MILVIYWVFWGLVFLVEDGDKDIYFLKKGGGEEVGERKRGLFV